MKYLMLYNITCKQLSDHYGKGFYLYLAGELLPYIGFIVAGKESMAAMDMAGGGAGQMAGVVIVGLMLIFDTAFVIMYAVNLKKMN